MRALLLMLALVALPAQAREWTHEEVRWGAAFAALRVLDWSQTRYIARHPESFREANPLLPEHPSLGRVNQHFIVSTAVMFAMAHYLPRYRKPLLQLWVAAGVVGTARNFHIGVGLSF